MSLFDTFDIDGEEIISPKNMIKSDDDIPERLLVFFAEKYEKRLFERFDCVQCSSRSAGGEIPIFAFEYKGERLGFYRSPIGGAVASGIMEEIAFENRHKFLFFGSCGSLDSGISAGHLIIPTQAYRDEGTSYHYAAPSDYIEVKSAEKMAQVLEEIGAPFRRARVWTTDSFYRETKKNMLARKADGCAAVEMECASIMACAQFRGYEVYEFIYAADCLDGEGWDRRILGADMNDMFDSILNTSLEALIRL